MKDVGHFLLKWCLYPNNICSMSGIGPLPEGGLLDLMVGVLGTVSTSCIDLVLTRNVCKHFSITFWEGPQILLWQKSRMPIDRIGIPSV